MLEKDKDIENIYEYYEEQEDNEQEEYYEQEEEFTQIDKDKMFFNICITQLIALFIAIIWGYFGKIFWWNTIFWDMSLIHSIYIVICLFVFNTIFYIFRKQLKFMNYAWIIKKIYIPVFGQFNIWQCIILSILSGFCEEALFRGVMSVSWGIIISSIIFGLFHLGNKKLIFSGIWIAFIGFCFAYVYKITGNLGISIVAHSLNNFLCFIAVKFVIKEDKI